MAADISAAPIEPDELDCDSTRTRESFGFYNKNATIFECHEYWFEDVEFPEAAIQHRKEQIKQEYENHELKESTRLEHRARDRLFEDLGYWTVYFQPEFEDVEAALQAGLTPFYFKGVFYLALGACGMDLSPKLDAYQALVTGTVPRSTTLFTDAAYFEYVVKKDVADTVRRRVRK